MLFSYFFLFFQQSLCAEMGEELRFAVKCRASRQRPALRRQCSKCIPGTTYVPAAMEVPQENGILQMIEMRKSPINFDCGDSQSIQKAVATSTPTITIITMTTTAQREKHQRQPQKLLEHRSCVAECLESQLLSGEELKCFHSEKSAVRVVDLVSVEKFTILSVLLRAFKDLQPF